MTSLMSGTMFTLYSLLGRRCVMGRAAHASLIFGVKPAFYRYLLTGDSETSGLMSTNRP